MRHLGDLSPLPPLPVGRLGSLGEGEKGTEPTSPVIPSDSPSPREPKRPTGRGGRGERSPKSKSEVDLWHHERELWLSGASCIAGIDEAGRGPLAGPVVAAAVVLYDGFEGAGITDSKKLSPEARERAFVRLHDDARVLIGIGQADPAEIDRLNILQATHLAMRRALAALPVSVDSVLVDGLPVRNLHANCTALVKGDSRSLSIAAASIIAKVTRDRLMCGVHHAAFPAYDFARHKGYPTPDHLRALEAHGPSPLHRRSFAPVAQCALRFDTEPVTDAV